MKIALLHYSFWPEVGGVEQVMRDQANLLLRAGHDVTVLCGLGLNPDEGYRVLLMPSLAPDFPLNAKVRAVLEQGQADQNFNRYRALLLEAMREVLAGIDLALVHNVFTMHHNLVLSLVLHELSRERRMVAWTHDLAVTNPDYAVPNQARPPWSLMRTGNPQVRYVAVSDRCAHELWEELTPGIDAVVVPDPVDPVRLFGLTPEMRESYDTLDLPARDFVFLTPAPTSPRKNLDFAIEVVRRLCAAGRDPLLLITAPPVRHSAAAEQYGAFLRKLLPEELKGHVVFLHDFFVGEDETLRDLYLLADCLFFPSRRESFGLPPIEAARFRLPVWCGDIPGAQALADDGAVFVFDDLARLPEAVAWLEAQPLFRRQRRCRQLFDPGVIYRDHYAPLLASLTADKM